MKLIEFFPGNATIGLRNVHIREIDEKRCAVPRLGDDIVHDHVRYKVDRVQWQTIGGEWVVILSLIPPIDPPFICHQDEVDLANVLMLLKTKTEGDSSEN